MAKLKLGVGFHTGVPCLCNGIGDYLSNLADNGHVITAKCNDGTSSLMDFQHEIQNGAEGYGIYRTLKGHDVPPYGADIKETAKDYFEKIVGYFPPELDKSLFYVECMNEVDKNHADWIGELLCEIARLMLLDGRKFCGPGWSTGEPESPHWGEPGMLKWLQMCADYRGQLAISLHEYSLIDELASTRDYLMGRTTWMNRVCINNGIPLPDVFVSEFGWMYQDAPSWQNGVPQIIDMVKWYIDNAPNVRALHIWALDSSSLWGDLNKTINPYMTPLANEINATSWSVPVIPDYPDIPDPPPPDPDDPSNLLDNGGFDNRNWSDQSDQKQTPYGWTGRYTRVGDTVPGGRFVASVEAERVHKFVIPTPPDDKPTLPANQGLGGDTEEKTYEEGTEGLILSNNNCFKVFGPGKWHDGLDQIVVAEPNTEYVFSGYVDVHWHGYPPGDNPPEEEDIVVQLQCNTSDKWYVSKDFPDQTWHRVEAKGVSDQNGDIKVSIDIFAYWEHPRSIFLESFTLTKVAVLPPDPPDPPVKKIKFVEYIYPQEEDFDYYQKVTRRAWFDYKRTVGGSVDHAIAALDSEYASNDSYAVVWNPDYPSQQRAIDALSNAGISYKTRYINPPPADPFPANISLGHLFRYRYVLTSPFNAPRDYYNNLHEGVDYDLIGGLADNTVAVLCAYPGVVESARMGSAYGLRVRVRHELDGHVFYTWYCHLDEIRVGEGDTLAMGDDIGEVGDTGIVTGEHVHFNLVIPGHGLSGYAIDDVVDPIGYLPDPSGLPMYNPPQAKVYDTLEYMMGDGRMYEVRHASGHTETFQVQKEGNEFWLVKNSQWEHLLYDGQYIWRDADTSPGKNPYAEFPDRLRWYTQFESGKPSARWCMRYMTVGQQYVGPGHTVQFYYKDMYDSNGRCLKSKMNSGPATNMVTLTHHWDQFTFDSGITLYDLIGLQTNTGELMMFAKGFGLVAWRNSEGGESAISEIHMGRDDLVREDICFPPS